MQSIKTKLLPLLALMLCMGAMLFAGTVPAYAADIKVDMESLSVEDVWLTGETLHIIVTDTISGEQQTLELNLRDYAKPGDEFVTVQAVDTSGRVSNTIQFKNPFYEPPTNTANDGETPAPFDGTDDPTLPVGSNPTGDGRPFTPNGTGTVVDNATDDDGKEFFTVETPDGNTFYLIIDRQRNADNVYLLNTVTEADLMALAEKSGKPINNGIVPDPTQPDGENPPPTTTPEPETKPSTGNNSSIILIVLAVAAVGGAGYYFKIVRPKQNSNAYDDETEEFDEDEELDVDDDGEEDYDE